MVYFAAGQRESQGKPVGALQNEDWSEEALEGELLELSASFWKQRLQGDPFASPLWNLLVCWGSTEIRGLHIYSFTYFLAGIMYVGSVARGMGYSYRLSCKATYSNGLYA